eukprot:scaffold840_cov344-Pavlova_lutheri.AAC.70
MATKRCDSPSLPRAPALLADHLQPDAALPTHGARGVPPIHPILPPFKGLDGVCSRRTMRVRCLSRRSRE